MSGFTTYPAMDIRRENQFWLRIFRDHSQFMMETFVPRETALIAQTQRLSQIFDQLLQQADRDISQQAAQAVMEFRCFQLSVIDLQLPGKYRLIFRRRHSTGCWRRLRSSIYVSLARSQRQGR